MINAFVVESGPFSVSGFIVGGHLGRIGIIIRGGCDRIRHGSLLVCGGCFNGLK